MDLINTLVQYFIFGLLSLLVTQFIFNNFSTRNKARKIYIIASLTYLLFTIIAYWAYYENGQFHYIDEDFFYEISQNLARKNSIKEIFYECKSNFKLSDTSGANFYMGSIGFITNKYLGGNSVFFQMANVSFLAALINIFSFKILSYFIHSDKAYRSSLVFIFCSYIFFYAPWILRDIHIALFYSMGLTIMFSKFKITRLLLLLGLIILTIQFRFEHGIFMFFMPLLYIFEYSKKGKIIGYGFFIIIGIILLYYSANIISATLQISKSLDNYNTLTNNSVAESGGLAQMIYKLPFGIKQLAITTYSQFSPFPSWNLLLEARNIPQGIIGIIQMISPLFWFLVWFTIIKLSSQNKLWIFIPRILTYSFIIAILFIIANSNNMTIRRILCIYPIIYIIYCIAKSKYPKLVDTSIRQGILTYLILSILYIIIKGNI